MVARVDNVLPLNVIHTVLDDCDNVLVENLVLGWLRQCSRKCRLGWLQQCNAKYSSWMVETMDRLRSWGCYSLSSPCHSSMIHHHIHYTTITTTTSTTYTTTTFTTTTTFSSTTTTPPYTTTSNTSTMVVTPPKTIITCNCYHHSANHYTRTTTRKMEAPKYPKMLNKEQEEQLVSNGKCCAGIGFFFVCRLGGAANKSAPWPNWPPSRSALKSSPSHLPWEFLRTRYPSLSIVTSSSFLHPEKNLAAWGITRLLFEVQKSNVWVNVEIVIFVWKYTKCFQSIRFNLSGQEMIIP